MTTYLTQEGIEVSGEGLDHLRPANGGTMNEEPWNKHTPGDPMPCKCGDSVVEVRFLNGAQSRGEACIWPWCRVEGTFTSTVAAWRFVERKGEDVIQRCAECDCEGGALECNWIASVPGDPYSALDWDKDDTAIVVLKKPGRPEWVQIDDRVRFWTSGTFVADGEIGVWPDYFAFQIKRRPALTPAVPQLLAVLSVATDDEADAIRSAARRANIEVPK